MLIRPTNKDDMDLLVTLIRNSFRDVAEKFGLTVENCSKSPAFYTTDRIRGDFENGLRYSILEADGRPCGCVALEKANPQVCYLMRLGVLPEYRSNGYGKALVNHIFEQARKMGAERVEIAIIAKDEKLKNWYKKLGFVEKGTKEYDHLPFIVGFLYKQL
jgi:ribosomal protein S18 acetylase RimI-like enzyme